MPRAKTREDVLERWVERDLKEAAQAGHLLPAYEVEDTISELFEIMSAGRFPVLSGESGVGKTAILHELVRRMEDGRAPEAFRGRRVLQLSLRARMSALSKPEEMRPETQKLIDALIAAGTSIIPCFSDIHLAYQFDLEPQLLLLAVRTSVPVLGEGEARVLDMMLEGTPDLAKHYVLVPVEEPGLARTRSIVVQWAARGPDSPTFESEALDVGLELTHRFLARSRMPRKVIDFLSQVRSVVEPSRAVRADDVIERFRRSYRVPRFLIDPNMAFDPDETQLDLRTRVLGQPEAVRTIVSMISIVKSGLSDSRRPFGAFLFVGPTGVGKTHIAQLLAELLFGHRDRMIRLNMADFQGDTDALTLFGTSYGSLSQQRGVLTARVAGHPFGVLLLDELEKANAKVHDRLLQLIDEGQFINAAGETVSCRSLIIIATSNAGAEVYRRRGVGFSSPPNIAETDRELDRLLYGYFRLEFLNRFDQIVHFHPLTRDDSRTIALREIEELGARSGLRARGLQLSVDDSVLDWIAARGFDPQFGARFLKRAIERNVTCALADLLVREMPEPGTCIELTVRGQGVVARLSEPPPPIAEARGAGAATEQPRPLDVKALWAEAERIFSAAEPLIRRLAERRRAASQLVTAMSEPGFWDTPAEAQDTLERFRELDVTVQAETRWAATVERLRELRALSNDWPGVVNPDELAHVVDKAGVALHAWLDRDADEGPGRAWLLVRNTDLLHPDEDWLSKLVRMELSWCRRLNLVAEIVAYGLQDDKLVRVVVEVEGRGAAHWLAMEAGTHRYYRGKRSDTRVRVDLVVESPDALLRATSITTMKPRDGLFGLKVGCSARIESADGGLVLDLLAADRDVLAELVAQLEAVSSSLRGPVSTARLYSHGGAGARDPRTDAVVSRLKDVLRGRLDPLLEAWRHWTPPPTSDPAPSIYPSTSPSALPGEPDDR